MSSRIHSVSRGHNNNRIEHAEEGSDAVNHWNIGGADRLDVSFKVRSSFYADPKRYLQLWHGIYLITFSFFKNFLIRVATFQATTP